MICVIENPCSSQSPNHQITIAKSARLEFPCGVSARFCCWRSCVILAGVAAVYYAQQSVARRTRARCSQAPAPRNQFVGERLDLVEASNQRTEVQVSAKSLKELKSPSRFYLEGVEVRISSADGSTFDRFKTAGAEFDTEQATLYADGEVEVTTGEPASGKGSRRLRSSFGPPG